MGVSWKLKKRMAFGGGTCSQGRPLASLQCNPKPSALPAASPEKEEKMVEKLNSLLQEPSEGLYLLKGSSPLL